MKQMLITCCILAAVTGPAKAQITRARFTIEISRLDNAVMSRSLSKQDQELLILEGMMNNQISYLETTKNAKTSIVSDQQILKYVLSLPTNKIVEFEMSLMTQLKQFSTTCQ